MIEKDVRLLFAAGHWYKAIVFRDPVEGGWKVCLVPKEDQNPQQILDSKRGHPRLFKTSDAAIQWCKETGFQNVTIQFDGIYSNTSSKYMKDKTVLLVEDNPNDIELTLRAFKNNNIKSNIVVTQDGQEALDYLFAGGEYQSRNSEDVPNLILLDINLPKVSGLEVLKTIRDSDLTRFIPVVLLTTSDENSDIISGYKLGSNSYIKKPVNFQVFSDMIKDLGQYWLQINTPPPNFRPS